MAPKKAVAAALEIKEEGPFIYVVYTVSEVRGLYVRSHAACNHPLERKFQLSVRTATIGLVIYELDSKFNGKDNKLQYITTDF